MKVRSTEKFHPARNIVEQPKSDDIPCGKSRPLGYRGRLESIGYRVHQSKSQKRDSCAIHSSSMNQFQSIHRRRRNSWITFSTTLLRWSDRLSFVIDFLYFDRLNQPKAGFAFLGRAFPRVGAMRVAFPSVTTRAKNVEVEIPSLPLFAGSFSRPV